MKKLDLLKYGVGLDIGKKKFHACIKEVNVENGVRIVASKAFDNAKSGHERFFKWLEKKRKDKKIPYQVLMEVTGVYHESLLYYLYDCKVEVCLEMPKKVKRYLESLGQKTKTDKEDSKGIAQMACERKLKRWKPLSTNIRELRAVIRYRKSLIMSKNQFSNRMHAISVSTLDSKKVKKSLTAMIKRLAAEIKKMEKDAIALMKKDKPVYEKAKMISDSINGLGIMSILAVLSETNGFEEITSQKQLESYAGFDIIENSSGEHQGKTKYRNKEMFICERACICQ